MRADSPLLSLVQYHIRREEVNVTALDLLNTNVPGGITEVGVRSNCMALLHYCANWVGGLGCVPVDFVGCSLSESEEEEWEADRDLVRIDDGGRRNCRNL